MNFSEINDIDSAVVSDHREDGILKRKFGEIKSLYGTCIQRFITCGQGEEDCFPNFAQGRTFVIYAHCLKAVYTVFSPLMTRSLKRNAQPEVGSEEGDIAGVHGE